jgi:hypothetical protein
MKLGARLSQIPNSNFQISNNIEIQNTNSQKTRPSKAETAVEILVASASGGSLPVLVILTPMKIGGMYLVPKLVSSILLL